jgi:soluble lytic murein transglycosylase
MKRKRIRRGTPRNKKLKKRTPLPGMHFRRRRGIRGIRLFVFLVFILSVFSAYVLFNTRPYQPTAQMRVLIAANAERYHLKPELLQAVMETESKYDQNAVSHIGAIGTMQLVPETAQWISEQSGLPYGDLKDPEINVPLGAWYIYYLLDKYDGNAVLALAAYNAGRGNVDQWMEDKHWPANFSDIDEIPFPETREFVKSVLRIEKELEKANKQTKAAASQSSSQNTAGNA